jgi:hypothetical protein
MASAPPAAAILPCVAAFLKEYVSGSVCSNLVMFASTKYLMRLIAGIFESSLCAREAGRT